MSGHSWQQFNLDGWVTAATARHAEIESLHLVGSRAAMVDVGPESDWDIVVALSASCYAADGEPIADIERRIACDTVLDSEPVDIWFLRPDDRLARPQPNGETWIDDVSDEPAGWRLGSEYARCLYGPSLVADTETRFTPGNPAAGIDDMTMVLARWLTRN